MWSTISTVLGVFTRPCFTQYFWWIAKILPVGSNLHIVGIAALCWAIWKTRNNACFKGKLISSLLGLICYMCAFLRYTGQVFRMRRTRSCCWRGPLVCRWVLRRLMRCQGLPELLVQESKSVRVKTMKSSLLDEERGA
jgi:uncharacterized membrane protein HdeD (DUF308 family)